MQKKQKGFTLLEILLVIATIGILAAIVLVAINPTRQINQARTAAVNSEKNTIEKALQQRLIDTGNYPSGLNELQRKVCSSTVTNDCVDLSGLIPDYIAGVPESTTYTVARGNNGRVYINTTETAANLNCPTGYIRVPGNSLYNTKDFCIMKYEAKAVALAAPTVGLTTPNTGLDTINNSTTATTVANGRAVASVASGFPIASINQTTAASYCSTAGASLITNAEWMTIARNIEAQPSNWRDGTIGSLNSVGGGLWRGHSDDSPSRALIAGADNDPYAGTLDIPPSRERRTHTLSNGEIIWDLSGNVWEWNNDTITGANQPTITVASPIFGWRQFDLLTSNGSLNYDDYRPSNNTWNSNQNMGRIYSEGYIGNNTIYGFLRGGYWYSPANEAGVFALRLDAPPSFTRNYYGFRCVVR